MKSWACYVWYNDLVQWNMNFLSQDMQGWGEVNVYETPQSTHGMRLVLAEAAKNIRNAAAANDCLSCIPNVKCRQKNSHKL